MTEPDERLTIYHCPGCEMNSMIGENENFNHTADDVGDQIACKRCGTRLSAECIYDYVDARVFEHK